MTDIFKRPPNVYTMPPGAAFMEGLYEGIRDVEKRLAIPAHDITVFLPTRRAIRTYQECVLEQTGGQPALLPKLRALGDIEEADLLLSAPGAPLEDLSLPPSIPPLKRIFLLYNLILKKSPQTAIGPLSGEQGLALAEELAGLLDQMNNEGLGRGDLQALYPKELSNHWQNVVAFLDLIFTEWPKILKREGFLEPVTRRNRLIEALIKSWQKTPPKHPVIAAGSTGSVPAVRALLKTIAGMPKGAIVFPGLDTAMDDACWDTVGETHPQHIMKQTLAAFGIVRGEVMPWPFAKPPPEKAAARLLFARDAMRPFETTAQWHTLPLDHKAIANSLDVVECPTPREEAGVIALAMREALEAKDKTAALVTADRKLAQLVKAELARWNITVNDSAGRPLRTTPTGTYLALLAAMVFDQFSPVSLLAFLKHPFCAATFERKKLLQMTRHLDRQVLRGVKPAPGLRSLKTGEKQIKDLLRNIEKLAAPFTAISGKKTAKFTDLVAAHMETAVAFCSAENGQPKLWLGEDGEALADFLGGLSDHAADFGTIAVAEYPAVLKTLMDMPKFVVRPKKGAHPRLSIWGALESRLQDVDLMILGGLNENSWPPQPADDPWMSREMRHTVGLPTPDQRIGQSANDFMTALGARDVILTRAEKIEGTPATPSRWLQRMKALLKGQLPGGQHPWLSWYLSMDLPKTMQALDPPQPTPPLATRPRQLSVTKIETWMRDPYAIYARYILGLEPLDGLEEDPSALEKGTILHEILERFMKETEGVIPADGLQKLIEMGRAVFREKALSKPAVKVFWQPRFEGVAEAYVNGQLERQQHIKVLANEVPGQWEIKGTKKPFTLRAKADRIDQVIEDGSLVVIDYKTGAGKTGAEIKSGHSPQLPLEGVMLQHGAFEGLQKTNVSRLEYWTIGNPAKPAEVKEPIKETDVPATLEEAGKGLVALVDAFDDDATPYLAIPDPERAAYGEYDHLARVKEWQNKGRPS